MSDVEEEWLLRFLREDGATREFARLTQVASTSARVIPNDTVALRRARHSDQRTANRIILPALY